MTVVLFFFYIYKIQNFFFFEFQRSSISPGEKYNARTRSPQDSHHGHHGQNHHDHPLHIKKLKKEEKDLGHVSQIFRLIDRKRRENMSNSKPKYTNQTLLYLYLLYTHEFFFSKVSPSY